jgi:nucleoside-diphosphate-sugar epimerase
MKYRMLIIIIGKNGFVSKSIHSYFCDSGVKSFLVRADPNELVNVLKNSTEVPLIIFSQGPKREHFNEMQFMNSLDFELLNVLRNFQFNSLLISSLDVYDFGFDPPWKESSYLTSNKSYGAYKVNQEKLLSETSGSCVILRAPTIWGGEYDISSFIFMLCRQAILSKQITIPVTENVRSILHIKYLSSFIYKFATNMIFPTENVYNMCDTAIISVKEIADIVSKFTNCEINYGEITSNRPNNLTIDNSRMISEFGDISPIDIHEGIFQMINRIKTES